MANNNNPNAPNHHQQQFSLVPIPRLCVLTKSSDAEEYGFNLHAEMGRGQFVGAVDIGSAAQMADLRPGDHIVAVNGQSIGGLSHKEVVQRIKSNPIRCSLLVLDEDGVLWHKENNFPITAEHILRRLNNAADYTINEENDQRRQQIEEEEKQQNIEIGIDVPIPLPRKRSGQPGNWTAAEVQQISPTIGTSPSFGAYGTEEEEESGSCSIALPISIPGSPHQSNNNNNNNAKHSIAQEGEETPIPIQMLALELEEQNQRKQSPPHSHSFVPNSAIGRHAAVSVPPPATLLANGPKPKFCTLQKFSAIQEFGFNLHAERGKGHFIGAVDKNGIAEQAGLETGQRIVGVNGRLVFPNTPHKEIVQLIKRDPLCTELLVASEEVDRFYAEYGLAFTYDFVQCFDRIHQNGIPGKNGTGYRQGSSIKAQNDYGHQQISRQNRTSSGSSAASMDGQKGNRNGNGNAVSLRSMGNLLGQRPPTPTSTYSEITHHGPSGPIAVQIKQRADNMTSIILFEEMTPNDDVHQFIGIGTPPSSRCDEKSEKEEDGHLQENNGNGLIRPMPMMREEHHQNEEKKKEQKHVIADFGISPPPSSAIQSNRPTMNSPLPLQPLTIFPPNQIKKAPIPLPKSETPKSRGSSFEKRDFGKDIFALNAKEARKAICGRKKDPRLEGQMSLEEKHRLILDL